jgi:hypothetical protein
MITPLVRAVFAGQAGRRATAQLKAPEEKEFFFVSFVIFVMSKQLLKANV